MIAATVTRCKPNQRTYVATWTLGLQPTGRSGDVCRDATRTGGGGGGGKVLVAVERASGVRGSRMAASRGQRK